MPSVQKPTQMVNLGYMRGFPLKQWDQSNFHDPGPKTKFQKTTKNNPGRLQPFFPRPCLQALPGRLGTNSLPWRVRNGCIASDRGALPTAPFHRSAFLTFLSSNPQIFFVFTDRMQCLPSIALWPPRLPLPARSRSLRSPDRPRGRGFEKSAGGRWPGRAPHLPTAPMDG